MLAQFLERVTRTLVDPGLPDQSRCGHAPAVPPETAETIRAAFTGVRRIEFNATCLGQPSHSCPHFSLLASWGTGGGGLWLIWRGGDLLPAELPWCTAPTEKPCVLFDRHPGRCL